MQLDDRLRLAAVLRRYQPFILPVHWELLWRVYHQGETVQEAAGHLRERYGWPPSEGAGRQTLKRLIRWLRQNGRRPTPRPGRRIRPVIALAPVLGPPARARRAARPDRPHTDLGTAGPAPPGP